MRVRDVVVVGGGPAGLAVAIAAASRGLEVLVLERRQLPADKACGEGLLPAGVRALERLGVRRRLRPDGVVPVRAIRWIDGALAAEAQLPAPGGLGVRRTALSGAFLAAALEAGAEVRTGVAVRAHRRGPRHVEVETEGGAERGRVLVAADGLCSSVRRREGLEGPASATPRFGIRRHFTREPWTDAVEVHFGDGVEAYVTPAGRACVGVAFLCESGARKPFPVLLDRFPALRERLAGAPHDSPVAGAGPFPCDARARALDRLVLVGDAAGYVDAITGEGLSLAFEGALALGDALPDALSAGATRAAFAAWERGEGRRYRRYAWTARAVLGLARRASIRRPVMTLLARQPGAFSALVGAVVG